MRLLIAMLATTGGCSQESPSTTNPGISPSQHPHTTMVLDMVSAMERAGYLIGSQDAASTHGVSAQVKRDNRPWSMLEARRGVGRVGKLQIGLIGRKELGDVSDDITDGGSRIGLSLLPPLIHGENLFRAPGFDVLQLDDLRERRALK